WAAVGVTVFFLCRLPWWGIDWLARPSWPELPGRVLQNAVTLGALGALVLLWWLSRAPADGPSLDTDVDAAREPADAERVGR
ncbi:MAG: glycosyltransferase 87 family protein, partial [Dermatophilaceae bacterium]